MGAAASSLGSAVSCRVEGQATILLWGNVSSQIHLISPGCPRPNSALTVHKSGIKHRSSIHLIILYALMFLVHCKMLKITFMV